MIITTEFDLDEVVEIYDIEIEGLVIELKVSGDGRVTYLIEYWAGLKLESV
jgi:hypothetical protein